MKVLDELKIPNVGAYDTCNMDNIKLQSNCKDYCLLMWYNHMRE